MGPSRLFTSLILLAFICASSPQFAYCSPKLENMKPQFVSENPRDIQTADVEVLTTSQKWQAIHRYRKVSTIMNKNSMFTGMMILTSFAAVLFIVSRCVNTMMNVTRRLAKDDKDTTCVSKDSF